METPPSRRSSKGDNYAIPKSLLMGNNPPPTTPYPTLALLVYLLHCAYFAVFMGLLRGMLFGFKLFPINVRKNSLPVYH